ncbi:MAG: CAAX prenyl protease-related protein [Nanoarchaeota archaeon]|nr:MAG: CAAX prenyl protease-related protein [Nanoarchaeota archaeon]
MLPFVLPFLAYVFIPLVLQPFSPIIGQIAKLIVVAGLVFHYRKNYKLKLLLSPLGIAAGVLIAVIWIALEGHYPYFLGTPDIIPTDIPYLAMRFLNSILLAPVIEEFFTRYFLNRIIQEKDWKKVPIYRFTAASFIITALFFGLSHSRWLPGIITGIILNLLLIKTKKLEECIIAHATANLALGIYVISTHSWIFWG